MIYRPQLDGLRAIAVAAVAWSHWERPYQFGLPFGSGVHLFYVLSGFLITGILLGLRDLENRAYAMRAFYIRRALRIFPAFYLVLALTAWADVPPVRDSWFWHATYLSNVYVYQAGEWPGAISHFWSLAVEEQFYLLWPWFIVFAPRQWIVPGILVCIASAPAFRAALAAGGQRESFLAILTPGCLDSLGVGALLAVVSSAKASAERPAWLHPVLLLCGAAWIPIHAAGQAGLAVPPALAATKQTLQAAAFGWLVLRAADGFEGVTGRLLASAPMVYLGRISYGLYLAHGFAGPMVRGLLALVGLDGTPLPEPFRFFALTAVTIAAAALSWTFFEAPINALKNRFHYTPSPAVANRELQVANRELVTS